MIQTAQNEFLTEFFNSDIVMTRRRLSTYLKTYKIPRQSLRQLNNKKLLLIGGGNSRIQHAFNMLKINCHVTNIDPYIINPQTAKTNIKCDFNETNFVNEFDEIWAMYSLPLYSPTVSHAAEFYRRATIALKPGGTLRIGGHPKNEHGILSCPIHFPRDKFGFQLLDLIISTEIFNKFYTRLPKLYPEHEEYTAPRLTILKNKLNKHINQSR